MPRILIIEDEPLLREDIMDWLAFEGYEVVGAENGREGLNRAFDSHPDLILSDITMPELDGYHVLIELRMYPKTALIPFIFLTAKVDRWDMRSGMDLGADDYITKPFSREELLNAVHSRLNKRETQREVLEQDIADLRSTLARTLPHELRTPLMGIIGFSELLRMDAANVTPTQIVEYTNHVIESGQRLYRLIENYLLYAQLDLSLFDSEVRQLLQNSRITFPDLIIAEAATKVAYRYERINDLVLELTSEAICIAENELSKIVTELIDNTFKFSQPETLVHIVTSREGAFYCIKITDHGIGMTSDQIARIAAFTQFNRASREQQGSGLGLIIAKRLVELFDGSLTIDSVPGSFTTIQVQLLISTDSA
jgi:signal transduction histidine kinase